MAKNLKALGANLNVEKVLEYAMVHDLGELLGGDISMPYARANRKAYRLAKAFEMENQRYLSKFFGKLAKNYRQLGAEVLNAKTDEARIAKISDYFSKISLPCLLPEKPSIENPSGEDLRE